MLNATEQGMTVVLGSAVGAVFVSFGRSYLSMNATSITSPEAVKTICSDSSLVKTERGVVSECRR